MQFEKPSQDDVIYSLLYNFRVILRLIQTLTNFE